MSKPLVAVVGRPNVGKSTLFNKLIGSRLSIVDDTPGVTRDRIYAPCEWCGHKFMLVDTGGIEPYSQEIIPSQIRAQAELAIELCDVICLMRKYKIEPKIMKLAETSENRPASLFLIEGRKDARPGLLFEKPYLLYKNRPYGNL